MLVSAEFVGSVAMCRSPQQQGLDRTAYQLVTRALLEMRP